MGGGDSSAVRIKSLLKALVIKPNNIPAIWNRSPNRDGVSFSLIIRLWRPAVCCRSLSVAASNLPAMSFPINALPIYLTSMLTSSKPLIIMLTAIAANNRLNTLEQVVTQGVVFLPLVTSLL